MTRTPRRARLTLAEAPQVTYVIGDVHGQADLFDEMEERIRADAALIAPRAPILVVLVGDVIDRGPSSSKMLDRLVEGTKDGLQRLCLLGNHEAMFLSFLDAPDGQAPWLNYGGRETLMSYGVPPDAAHGYDMPARRLTQMLAAHIPQAHIDLMRSMPVTLRLPGYLICHAGIEPGRSLAQQADDDLIWGDPHAIDSAPYVARGVADLNAHKLVVVHGHVPQPQAEITPRRIALDTGAYATRRLSAVRLTPNNPPVLFEVGEAASFDIDPINLAITKA